MSELIDLIAEAGLFQFGLFQTRVGDVPFRAILDSLPSYPDVLHTAAEEMYSLLREDLPERILCAYEDFPIGISLSLLTGIPLVYSRGVGKDAVYDLVGAYNSGHPTVLILTEYRDADSVEALAQRAEQVGLQVTRCVSLFETGATRRLAQISFDCLVNLRQVLHRLVENGVVPVLQASAVLEWINTTSY